MSHYSNGTGDNVVYNNGQLQYSTVHGSYPTYSTGFVPSQQTTSSMFLPSSSSTSLAMQYNVRPGGQSLPSQPLPAPRPSYYSSPYPTNRPHASQSRFLDSDLSIIADTESQESFNHETMFSEPIIPPLEGYPNVQEFDDLMKRYVADLSPKKRDKALIHSRRAANIRAVLVDRKTTTVESAQFRFWVKKMFVLLPDDPKVEDRKKKICHEGKPVAIREKLFKILTRAHKACQHGGRDKTSAQVRRVYSWVPKELISRFVKLCPTCQIRRGTNRHSPNTSDKSPELYMETTPSDTMSSPSQRDSTSTKRNSYGITSPIQFSDFSTNFQTQNRWMTPVQPNPDRVSQTSSNRGSFSTMRSYSTQSNMTGRGYSVTGSGTSRSTSTDSNAPFPSANNMHNISHCHSSGYGSNNQRLVNGHYPVHQGYVTKQESRY